MTIENLLAPISDVTEVVTQQDAPHTEVSQVAEIPEVETVAPAAGNVLRDAFSQYNPIGQTQRLLNQEFTPAGHWDFDANKDELLQGIDEQYHTEIAGADSLESAQRIKGEVEAEQLRLQTIKDGGLLGTAATVGAILLDPTLVVGGGAMVTSLKAARIARLAVEGGTTGLAVTGLEAYANAETDAGDVMLATLLGAGIGGTLGSFSKVGRESNEILQRTEKTATKEAIARHASAAETQHASRFTMTETEEDIIAESVEWASENKMKRGTVTSQVMDSISEKFHSSLKTDSTNLWNSKSSVAQKFTHDMAESGSGIYARSDTAAQVKDFTERRFMSKFMPDYEGLVKGYGKENGIKGRANQAEDFNRALRIELENARRADIDGVPHTPTSNQHVAQAAEKWQAMADDVLTEAASSGVRGFDEIKRIAGYVPLSWNGAKLRSLSQPTYKAYTKLLAKGYRSVGIDNETAQKIALAVLDRTGRKELRLDSNVSALFSGDAAAELKTLLGDEQFEAVAAIVKGKSDDAGKSSAARSRTDVDLTVTDANGFSLMDIVNNDMQFIASKYSQEMAGRVSLAQKGVKSEGDYNRILEAALKQEAENGGDIELLRNSMDSVYNQLLSRPATGEGIHKGVRRALDFASVSMLGAMGMAQLAEYGPILAQLGVRDVFSNVKMLDPRQFQQQFEPELLKDMQSLLGKVGQEELLYSPYVRLEDKGDAVTNGLLKKYDDISARATYLNGVVSLNNTIKRHQQRISVTIGAAKAVRMIKEGTHEGNKFFDEIGLDAGTIKEINKRIKSGDITFENGGLSQLNLSNWSVSAGNNFAVAMNRHMNQVVQKSLAGESSFWMDSTLGKMMMQFRNYPVAAMGKQLTRAVRQGNATGLFVYSTMSAALAYNIKNAVQNKDTSGVSTHDHVVRMMSMSSPAGLLPDMYTTTMSMMGNEDLGGRLTEYSNPTLSLLNAGMKSPQAAANILSGEGTKGDINTMATITPFSNILGVSAYLNTLKQDL